ncbi:hypothetical protein K7B10_30220 [Streptomyces flavotricini]|uniref:FXSXX-COOH protein n=1 Tax=Streptomyces flavotricini TaxID=66888 RepID=A0ABS8EE21_9ACTN|nr:hypothetical protein [Streptomyces flavotricini]MCC0098979.1 hypothetical protein [Streptomyces flavotricini]
MTPIQKHHPAAVPVDEEHDGRPSPASLATLAARGGADTDRRIDRVLPGGVGADAVRTVTFNSSL